jgi:hypothetical protein
MKEGAPRFRPSNPAMGIAVVGSDTSGKHNMDPIIRFDARGGDEGGAGDAVEGDATVETAEEVSSLPSMMRISWARRMMTHIFTKSRDDGES